ncbi:LINE-1 retrotransposable element ORF2 protein [Canna indica]|uniref:LINE-1 retrotransposable element ORF2 protein n=1 Tax=Canna indica TaxID=4628 RepID=A0AAQ3QP48_9LILI|nr:LINE-1 retrotransposable element ORF2 protein [Canna indica]
MDDVTRAGEVASMLGSKVFSFPISYLGFLLCNSRRCKDWLGVVQKVNRSVLSGILRHFLSIFRALKWVISLIDHRRRAFRWGGEGSNSGGRALIHWGDVTSLEKNNGLGILDMDAHNLARLGRWWWAVATGMDLLWVEIVRLKYFSKKR